MMLTNDSAQLLRQVEALLSEGDAQAALDLLLHQWPALQLREQSATPQTMLPPHACFLYGLALLKQNAPQGVARLFQAAEDDPALLGDAVAAVEKWLDGPGASHDSALLRHELTRMQVLFEKAQHERAVVDGSEECHPADADVVEAVRDALKPWRDDIRAAWIARRRCQHAPGWRHHELLLELKPRKWHFGADARERLQRQAENLRQAISLQRGTLAVRIYPLLALPAHVRAMRRQATPLFSDEAHAEYCKQQSASTETRQTGQTPAKATARRSLVMHGAASTLKSGMLATLLAGSLWAGWGVISNHGTQRQISQLEQRHAALLARQYWRREEAAGMFHPTKTVHAFLQALRNGKGSVHALLDEDSRSAWRRQRLAPSFLRKLAAHWQECRSAFSQVEMQRAVVRWRENPKYCMPMLLRRENGRWRIAWRDMQTMFRRNDDGSWHLTRMANSALHAWSFGFQDMVVDAQGRLLAMRGASGKGALILPLPPDGENASLRLHPLLEERRTGLHMAASKNLFVQWLGRDSH